MKTLWLDRKRIGIITCCLIVSIASGCLGGLQNGLEARGLQINADAPLVAESNIGRSHDNSIGKTSTGLRILDNYYVFAQGCILISGRDTCTNPPATDWHVYLDLLQQKSGLDAGAFTGWSRTHIKYARAKTADPAPIAHVLGEVAPDAQSILLIGHSAGGAAILNYLKSLRDQPSLSVPPIRAALIVHAPVGEENLGQLVSGALAGFSRRSASGDNLTGLGAFAKNKKIALWIVSYEDDWITSPLEPVADIQYKLVSRNPAYRVAPFDIVRKHGYLVGDYGGVGEVLKLLDQIQAEP